MTSPQKKHLFESLHAGLNDDLMNAFNTIMESYTKQDGGLFFVYGSGGTGKTYLWNTLITKFHSERKIVISVASSGIPALLLPGGKMAHSRFKISLNLDESSCCSTNLGTDLARLIQEASLIIWDEAPMVSRQAFEAVDRTFRDILKDFECCSKDRVFGGKLFVLGGDFRQILPVVTKGGREHIVQASLPSASIWDHCQVLYLRRNMRVIGQNVSNESRSQLCEFVDWILSVDEGKLSAISFSEGYEPNWIIPADFS